MEKNPSHSTHLVINHMIKEIKLINSTSSVPYGMLMILIFRHFGVCVKDKPRDDEVYPRAQKILQL